MNGDEAVAGALWEGKDGVGDGLKPVADISGSPRAATGFQARLHILLDIQMACGWDWIAASDILPACW